MNIVNSSVENASLVAPERTSLPVREKLAVGTGGLTVSLGNQSVRTTGQGVLNMVLQINAFWVGIVLALPLLWDALVDPVVGNFSDNYRSRLGRRRPFIFAGAILMALTFASIWMVPLGWSDAGKLVWFIVASLLFYTSYSIFSVPYIALTYEMTPDYHERTSVQGYVTFWNRVGEMTYMSLIPLSLTFIAWKYGYADTKNLTTGERMEGIRTMAAVFAFVGMALFGVLPALFARERLYELNVKAHHGQKDPFWKSAKLALQNQSCALLCVLSVCTIIAGVFASNMDWYLLIYYLSDGNIALGTQWKLIVTVGYATVGILGTRLFN
jgi:GPH family glycoside/pentoside/hexuronide:cation symporter